MPTTVFHDSSLSFLPPLWDNTPQNYVTTNQFYDFSTGSTSSSSPSSSSSSSSSSYNENSNHLSPMRSPDTTTGVEFSVSGGRGCHLQIIDEPYDKYRFRYQTELQGVHGNIISVTGHAKKSKIFPKVKLCGYTPIPGKEPIIRCSLYTADGDESNRTPHAHRMVRKRVGDAREVEDDPYDVVLSSSSDYVAEFQFMTILYTKKNDQIEVLLNKKKAHMEKMSTDGSLQMMITPNHTTEAKAELSKMNLNKVCLRFEALIDTGRGYYAPLGSPVFSKTINNMKNAGTNQPKICRFDRCTGVCTGKEEVFMFVEKVKKNDIKVKFIEQDDQGEVTWEAEANIIDVHHQFGIIFQTPPYKDVQIKKDVKVSFHLERPSDSAASESKLFTYTPDYSRNQIPRKRPRSADTTVPTTVLELNTGPIVKSATPPHSVPAIEPTPNNWENMLDYDLLYELMNKSPCDLLEMSPKEPELAQMEPEVSQNEPELAQYIKEYLENVPDTEKISQVINDSRFGEYLNTYSPGLDLQLDGVIKTEPKALEQADKESELPPLKTSSPISRLQDKLKASKTQDIQKLQKARTTSDAAAPKRVVEAVQLTEVNIVGYTIKTLNNLSLLLKNKMISVDRFRECLLRLFAFAVGDYDDNMVHIMATSDQMPESLPMVLTILKEYKVNKTILEYRNNKQETPLLVAASLGTPEMVSALLDAGAEVDAQDIKNNTTKHLAVQRENGAKEVLTELLKRPNDLTICNKDGYSAFHLAVLLRKPDLLTLLQIKPEASSCISKNNSSVIVNQQDMKHGNTALHIAVDNGFKEIVSLLLSLGDTIDIDIMNFAGKTPLALVYGAEDIDAQKIEQLLLSSKANPALVKKDEHFKDECNSGEESDIEQLDDGLSAYAREWGNSELFDRETISKLCPLLDKDGDWKILMRRLNFMESEIIFSETHWSPSLLALKTVADSKQEVTADIIRDHLMDISPICSQYIDEMILRSLGID